MLFWVAVIGAALLAHTAPFKFLFDVTDHTVWRMPDTDPPTVYLTFDDGPNPSATPDVLDVLDRRNVHATFFVIDKHLTERTVPIVRRAFDEGHAIAVHSDSRALMFRRPSEVARSIEAAAARIEQLTGQPPCRAFRPHAGGRSVPMLVGAARAGYRVIGWGWMLWDFNWFRTPAAATMVPRLADHASAGDIVVIHDGHHEDPNADRAYAAEAVDHLIPELRGRGFEFGTICP